MVYVSYFRFLDLPKEISNKEILNNYLPFARTCIHEACTLVAATRVMSEHISVPTDGSYTFSKQYGDSAQLKITFPSGVAEETLSLKVQVMFSWYTAVTMQWVNVFRIRCCLLDFSV